jgi:hypothetical protein
MSDIPPDRAADKAADKALEAGPPFSSLLEPGQFVRHPGQPDWGTGQVQSAIGERVTVNFDNAGKVVLNAREVALDVLSGPPARPA